MHYRNKIGFKAILKSWLMYLAVTAILGTILTAIIFSMIGSTIKVSLSSFGIVVFVIATIAGAIAGLPSYRISLRYGFKLRAIPLGAYIKSYILFAILTTIIAIPLAFILWFVALFVASLPAYYLTIKWNSKALGI